MSQHVKHDTAVTKFKVSIAYSANKFDSRTFKADIQDYLIYAWVFRIFWPKIGNLWGKIGEGVVRY